MVGLIKFQSFKETELYVITKTDYCSSVFKVLCTVPNPPLPLQSTWECACTWVHDCRREGQILLACEPHTIIRGLLETKQNFWSLQATKSCRNGWKMVPFEVVLHYFVVIPGSRVYTEIASEPCNIRINSFPSADDSNKWVEKHFCSLCDRPLTWGPEL